MEICLENCGKVIRSSRVLCGIQMKLTGGKIYGLQGPNGCGKTMLMRLVAGLIHPTEGKVLVDGRELGKERDFPESMGLLLENPAFLPEYTGVKNLELLAGIRQIATEEQLWRTLEAVGLDPDDKRKYRKYSLGMKQRLGIGAAIMEKPELILLDEPTNALDEDGIQQIAELIRQQRQRGALVILASHDGGFLESLADEIFVMSEGRITDHKLHQ